MYWRLLQKRRHMYSLRMHRSRSKWYLHRLYIKKRRGGRKKMPKKDLFFRQILKLRWYLLRAKRGNNRGSANVADSKLHQKVWHNTKEVAFIVVTLFKEGDSLVVAIRRPFSIEQKLDFSLWCPAHNPGSFFGFRHIAVLIWSLYGGGAGAGAGETLYWQY